MTYEETIDFLYQATPAFEQKGAVAYKPGLERMLGMSAAIGNPHQKLKAIHVAGTNGKGSVSSTIASVLFEAGYRVGLYTSPHLVSFRERIRINGQPIDKESVVTFVEDSIPLIKDWQPSFFEITTLMALDFFVKEEVDIAVLEVGMGGRLDSTNIISPILSIITNVSLDHTQYLGSTLEAIACEKGGIIKSEVPVVIGESCCNEIFSAIAHEKSAPLRYASDLQVSAYEEEDGFLILRESPFGALRFALSGEAQRRNCLTIIAALQELQRTGGVSFTAEEVQRGFTNVVANSHLLGRWQKVSDSPQVFLDTGHNEAGIQLVLKQLEREHFAQLHIVFGMVADKSWREVLDLLPHKASYYFSSPNGDRALDGLEMLRYAKEIGLKANAYKSPTEAYLVARAMASPSDLIYIGGSNYLVAELLEKVFPEVVEEKLL